MNKRPIGFIGLGRMGSAMARNLASAGAPLTVFDIQPDLPDALADLGVSKAGTPGEVAARVDLLFLCVPSEIEAETVLFGEDGVATGTTAPLPIVDTTTMNRGAAIRLAGRAAETALSYSDCPVSGKPFRAKDGTLTMMFGGAEAAFIETKPYLDVMGEFVVHCGELGAGQLMKANNNIIYDVNIAALCEVMPLAVKAGLAPNTLADVLTSGSARSFASEYFVPRILKREFDGDFSLRAAFKDIVNVQEVAADLGASLPVVEAMVDTYQTAIDRGFGDQAKSAMIKVYEERLGLTVTLPPSSDATE
jgi:3-hydroxyisobutyrate dehydrogenase-like beta-hydroxyacid dehydrogenase